MAANPKSPPAIQGQGHYRAGECLFAMGDYAGSAKRLAIFRDQGPFQNLPGLSDRALLRLGHALAHASQWDPSRQAHEVLSQRFPNSPWIHEARYGIGWAWQNVKQYDQAVNAYNQVTAATATEIGAKRSCRSACAGWSRSATTRPPRRCWWCRSPTTIPSCSAVALCEAARTFTELKDLHQAEKLLLRVIKDHPQSQWAEVAKKRLEALKKG